jgi:hypothetical protein
MTKSSERIEEEIDGIRDRMRSRVDSAARELSPKAIAARLTGKEDPSTTELLEWAVRKARNNPLSTALVAVGLLGFATQSNERARRLTRDGLNEGSRRVRGYAHDAGDIAVEKADDALHYAREATQGASRAIRRTGHDVEDFARRGADRSAEYGREGADWVRHNPTATGLFALAIGAAAASVFAARRREDPALKRLGADEPAPARRTTTRKTATAKKPATARKATAKSSTARKSASATKGSATTTRTRKAKTGAQKTAAKARATRATKPARSTAPRSPQPQSTPANTGPSPAGGIPGSTTSNESQIH